MGMRWLLQGVDGECGYIVGGEFLDVKYGELNTLFQWKHCPV